MIFTKITDTPPLYSSEFFFPFGNTKVKCVYKKKKVKTLENEIVTKEENSDRYNNEEYAEQKPLIRHLLVDRMRKSG